MEHYDVLNAILANDCPRRSSVDGMTKTFEFDLHCARVRVKAELISTVNTIQYKIVDFELI